MALLRLTWRKSCRPSCSVRLRSLSNTHYAALTPPLYHAHARTWRWRRAVYGGRRALPWGSTSMEGRAGWGLPHCLPAHLPLPPPASFLLPGHKDGEEEKKKTPRCAALSILPKSATCAVLPSTPCHLLCARGTLSVIAHQRACRWRALHLFCARAFSRPYLLK